MKTVVCAGLEIVRNGVCEKNCGLRPQFFICVAVAQFEDMLYNEIGTVNNWLTV